MSLIGRLSEKAGLTTHRSGKKYAPKIFCIGRNKTGTTSLKRTFEILGYKVGNQREAEKLLTAHMSKDYDSIFKYCRSAQVFQDIPFSLPGLYESLSFQYPDARFILTERSSADQWYRSLLNFHAKMFGNGNVPSVSQLKNADYVYKGWIWQSMVANFQTDESDPYHKEKLCLGYEAHNSQVKEFFRDAPNRLLVLNLEEEGSFERFLSFFSIKTEMTKFPWENKS